MNEASGFNYYIVIIGGFNSKIIIDLIYILNRYSTKMI